MHLFWAPRRRSACRSPHQHSVPSRLNETTPLGLCQSVVVVVRGRAWSWSWVVGRGRGRAWSWSWSWYRDDTKPTRSPKSSTHPLPMGPDGPPSLHVADQANCTGHRFSFWEEDCPDPPVTHRVVHVDVVTPAHRTKHPSHGQDVGPSTEKPKAMHPNRETTLQRNPKTYTPTEKQAYNETNV